MPFHRIQHYPQTNATVLKRPGVEFINNTQKIIVSFLLLKCGVTWLQLIMLIKLDLEMEQEYIFNSMGIY